MCGSTRIRPCGRDQAAPPVKQMCDTFVSRSLELTIRPQSFPFLFYSGSMDGTRIITGCLCHLDTSLCASSTLALHAHAGPEYELTIYLRLSTLISQVHIGHEKTRNVKIENSYKDMFQRIQMRRPLSAIAPIMQVIIASTIVPDLVFKRKTAKWDNKKRGVAKQQVLPIQVPSPTEAPGSRTRSSPRFISQPRSVVRSKRSTVNPLFVQTLGCPLVVWCGEMSEHCVSTLLPSPLVVVAGHRPLLLVLIVFSVAQLDLVHPGPQLAWAPGEIFVLCQLVACIRKKKGGGADKDGHRRPD